MSTTDPSRTSTLEVKPTLPSSGSRKRRVCIWLSFGLLFLLWLFSGTTNADVSESTVHGPIIQWHKTPATQATIVWIERDNDLEWEAADEPAVDHAHWTVEVRPKGSGRDFRPIPYRIREFGKTDNPVYLAEASGLMPDTEISYRLRTGDDILREGWFRTAPARIDEPMEFLVAGDMGTQEAIPLLEVATKETPLFVMIGGDIAYANGRNELLWYRWIDLWLEYLHHENGRATPMIMGIGNHEMKSYQGLKGHRRLTGLRIYRKKKKNAPFYHSLFALPEGRSNFTVDFASYMSIILLDSGHAQHVEDQTDWLEEELRERQDRDHLFTVYHRPAWGAGIKKNYKPVQEEWCPLFVEYGVECAFENDHHIYKRSHPIVDGEVDEENGVLYIGDGAWGAKLRPINSRKLKKVGADEYLAEWKAVHHYVRVTLRPNGSRMYEAVDVDGTVFDSLQDSGGIKISTPETQQADLSSPELSDFQ